MTGFAINALQFGVLGLCAIIVVLAWRILEAEQRREDRPREEILRFAKVLMAFSFAVALLSASVQVAERVVGTGVKDATSLRAQVGLLETESDSLRQQLSDARHGATGVDATARAQAGRLEEASARIDSLERVNAQLASSLAQQTQKLDRVISAMDPLLRVRGQIIAGLPDSLPEKETLAGIVEELRRILRQ